MNNVSDKPSFKLKFIGSNTCWRINTLWRLQMRPQTHGETAKFKNLKLWIWVQLYLYQFFDSFDLFFFLFFMLDFYSHIYIQQNIKKNISRRDLRMFTGQVFSCLISTSHSTPTPLVCELPHPLSTNGFETMVWCISCICFSFVLYL